MRGLVEVAVPPGPAGVRAVRDALAGALAGGAAVAPVPAGGGDYTDRIRGALRPDLPLERADVVAVVSTSGSTGRPKGVLLTEAALRTATSALETRLGGPGDWVVALPVHAVGGLALLVRALLAGTDLHIDPSAGGATSFDPAAFAATVEAAQRPGRPLYGSLVPTQLQRLVDAGRLDALRRFDAVLSGAAATPARLLDTLRRGGVRVLASYGMSETCGGCAYDGVPQPGITITTGAPDGRSLGRLSVSGPAVAAGYRLRPEDPALREGTVLTGDLGRLDGSGTLTVIGRVDDVVVVGGTNVALPAVEAVLRRHVAEAHVIAVPDDTWGSRVVAFLAPTGAGPGERALAEAVRGELGRAAVPADFVRLDEIPLLATGKPDRQALASTWRRGEVSR